MTADSPRLPGELELGAAITFLRRQAGMPQHELTRKLGLSARSNLSDYERGRRVPPPDIVLACEQIFGLEGGELQKLRRRTLGKRARESVPAPASPVAGPKQGTEQGATTGAAPAAPAGPEPEAAPRRSRQRVLLAAAATVVVCAALLAFSAIRADRGDHLAGLVKRSVPATPQPVRGTVSDRTHHDGDDPMVTGCSQDVITLVKVPVRLPDGPVFGHLLLRHSPSCAMSWGAVWGPNPHLYRVYIVASRPADHAVAASSWAGNTPPGSYGNMLSTVSSCVQLSAYVQTPAGPGRVARTPCLK